MKNEKPLKKRSWSTSRSRTCLLHTQTKIVALEASYRSRLKLFGSYANTLWQQQFVSHTKKNRGRARAYSLSLKITVCFQVRLIQQSTPHTLNSNVCCVCVSVCACESTFTNNRTDECWINIHFEFANTRKHTHIAHAHRYRRKRLMLWLAVWFFDLLRHSVQRIVMQKVMLLHVFHVMPMISIQWHVCVSFDFDVL